MGQLVVFEGVDGVGKSTIVDRLTTLLRNNGSKVTNFSFPGKRSRTLGSHVYKVHHDLHAFNIDSIDPSALQILHIAAHVDSIRREIIPSLAATDFVLLDRYWWSTRAYGEASGASSSIMNAALEAEKVAWNGVLPTNLFYITRSAGVIGDELRADRSAVLKLYDDLTRQYQSQFPVRVIANEGTIDSAVNVIHSVLIGD